MIEVDVSDQSEHLLEKIARLGIYGRDVSEVAARFIDSRLQEFVALPKLPMELSKATQEPKK